MTAGVGHGEQVAASEPKRPFWTVERLTSAPFLLVVATALLCALGLVMVFSASSIEAVEAGRAAWNAVLRQAGYMALAIVFCLVVRRVGGLFWVDLAFYVLWLAVLALLILVLAVGDESHGATRWIYVGPVSLQPSEFAKIVVIMAAARLLAAWEHRERPGLQLFVGLAVLVILPMGLVVLQKDLGTLLILSSTMILMLVLAGVRPVVIGGVVLVCATAAVLLILSSGYRNARFAIWLNPYSDYYGDGWQLIHGIYAFATGGFFGVGLGNSRQKYSYLPEAENDFIFAILGEELGFLGALLVVGLFVLFGVSGMRIAYAAKGRSFVSSMMAGGLTALILVQALLNMGGVLQVFPLSGRPLPFISAGGSSIVANMIIVGLILGVARDNACDVEERGRRRRGGAAGWLTLLEGGVPVRKRARRIPGERAAEEQESRRRSRSTEGRPSSRSAFAPAPAEERSSKRPATDRPSARTAEERPSRTDDRPSRRPSTERAATRPAEERPSRRSGEERPSARRRSEDSDYYREKGRR